MLKNIISALTGFAQAWGGISVAACAALATAAFIVYALLAIIKRGFCGKKRGNFYAICTLLAGFCGALYALNGIGGELFFSSAFLYLFYSLVLFLLPVRKDKRSAKAIEKQRELARYIDEKVRAASELSRSRGDFGRKDGNLRGFDEDKRKGEERLAGLKNSANVPFEYYEENSLRSESNAGDLPLAEFPSAGENVGSYGQKGCREGFCRADNAPKDGFTNELDYSHVKNVIARLDYFGLKESDRRQIHDLEASLSEAERGGCSQGLKERINDGLSSLLKIMSKYGA